jgi:hypothetical protein
MHVPVYTSSYIHSYLIALTLSCAPQLRGRLLVFVYLTVTEQAFGPHEFFKFVGFDSSTMDILVRTAVYY